MIDVEYSAALTRKVDAALRDHLLRADGQEDICFAIWHPSKGATRTTALIRSLILPSEGDRSVHGNASFHPQYFERALGEAAAAGGGLAMLHSHPLGRGWQGMSRDDVLAEHGHAASAYGATGLPFVGLTLAGDSAWSARFWPRVAPRTYERRFCGSVRVVGDLMTPHFYDALIPAPEPSRSQIRTVTVWGTKAQSQIARLRVAIVGAGSVGGMIAEAMARTGVQDITVIDFDRVEEHNLDRLVYATTKDIGRLKIEVLAEHLRASATATNFLCRPIDAAVYEETGLRAALDCDVIFSCVDRPWGRYVLNAIAYAHLIPVFDGGIAARTNKSGLLVAADWRAHTCAPGRACMACLGQYSSGHVQAEREGLLDDPKYIDGLPSDHPLKSRENVFAFSMACASLQSLQMLYAVVAPLGLPGPLPQLYHSVGGDLEPDQKSDCDAYCAFTPHVASGDHFPYDFVGTRPGRRRLPPAIENEDMAVSPEPAAWYARLWQQALRRIARSSR